MPRKEAGFSRAGLLRSVQPLRLVAGSECVPAAWNESVWVSGAAWRMCQPAACKLSAIYVRYLIRRLRGHTIGLAGYESSGFRDYRSGIVLARDRHSAPGTLFCAQLQRGGLSLPPPRMRVQKCSNVPGALLLREACEDMLRTFCSSTEASNADGEDPVGIGPGM